MLAEGVEIRVLGEPGEIAVAEVQREVGLAFHITVKQMISAGRRHHLAQPRMLAMALASQESPPSGPRPGAAPTVAPPA